MIVYRCDHCGETIPAPGGPQDILPMITVTTPALAGGARAIIPGADQHFCSYGCANQSGGYVSIAGEEDHPIYCAAETTYGRCKLLTGHAGDHVTFYGYWWPQ